LNIHILTPDLFIKQKAQQLVYFTNQLINQSIPFDEVHIVTWDILEEWSKINKEQQIDDYESVFWYLFFIIQFEEETDLIQNKQLRVKVNKCCNYLMDPSLPIPQNCIGIRP